MVTSKITRKLHSPNTESRPYRLYRSLSDADRRRIVANNDRRMIGATLQGGVSAE